MYFFLFRRLKINYDALEHIKRMEHKMKYEPIIYKGKTKIIEKYLILGEQLCLIENHDIFNMKIDEFAADKIRKINENGYSSFKLYESITRSLKYSDSQNSNRKKLFLYAEIDSATKTKIIVNMYCTINSKLWINMECISLNCQSKHVVTDLEKGKNIFLVELLCIDDQHGFCMQLLNYNFEVSNNTKAISKCGNMVNYDQLTLIADPDYLPTQNCFKFLFIPNNKFLYKDDFDIEILDSKLGLFKKLIGNLNEIIEIDIDKLRLLDSDTMRHEMVRCFFKRIDGIEKIEIINLFLFNNSKVAESYIEKLSSIIPLVDEQSSIQIQGQLSKTKGIYQNGYNGTMYWLTNENKIIFDAVENGVFDNEYYKKPGVHEFYILSKLDKNLIRLYMRIPKEFNKNIEYPLLISLSTSNCGWNSDHLPEEYISEPVIHIDITGRGFTGGSYIGEASTFEIIDWVKRNYCIDENRVYLTGYSNGAYATWAIAQYHPHLIASIFPLRGRPSPYIENTSNIPSFIFISENDPLINDDMKVKRKLSKYNNLQIAYFNQMTHHYFHFYQTSATVINQMLRYRKNMFPNQVIFKTERNRHLECYWIKLHGIKKGKKYARIKVNIISEKLIKIWINNSDGFTMTLPPQVFKEHFYININGKLFEFINQKNDQLHFVYNNNWRIGEDYNLPDYRKGTGLLDVYLNRLRIIIPKDIQEVLTIAQNFAHPFSNGLDPNICASYPIYTTDEIPKYIYDNNLLFIDVNGNNPFLSHFIDKLPIKCDGFGYEYLESRYDCYYVVMQIIPNPFYPDLSILAVQTNDVKLLGKDLFTRKVVIPYYCYGLHPYWNNVALIYTNSKYYAVYEWGTKLDEIK